ncbi:hypothetical protein [Spongiactinospora sp. TRM90649]|nr:hypothetical protein [Spongiactinospora sp. TRM90649]MDF5755089.1 hypothetical protein [Spongiactinospora sp. TRM90649]
MWKTAGLAALVLALAAVAVASRRIARHQTPFTGLAGRINTRVTRINQP